MLNLKDVGLVYLKFAFIVTLTTVTILWLTSATSSSSSTSSRHLFMMSSADNSITASKLYDVTAVSLIVCQSACLADDACLITVFNTQSQTCSLFTAGTTVYNITAGLKVNFIDSQTVSVSSPSVPTVIKYITVLNVLNMEYCRG
jgi:hypothetical protein